MIQVVTGVIRNERGQVFLQQRRRDDAFGLLWETPGGKVDDLETGVEALRRELREELGLRFVTVDSHSFLTTRFYPPVFSSEGVVRFYWVKTDEQPTPLEGQEAVKWEVLQNVHPNELVPGARVLRSYLRTMYGS